MSDNDTRISLSEDLVELRDASEHLPLRQGKPICMATLFRWVAKGTHGVKLEVLKVGGTTYTSKEALDRFARRCSDASR